MTVDKYEDRKEGKYGEIYVGKFNEKGLLVKGIIFSPHGSEFRGDFVEDSPGEVRLVRGSIIFHNGIIQEGEFNETGLVRGTMTYPDGAKEEGEFNETGLVRGTLTLPDGEKYEGEFKDGKYDGRGTLTLPDGEKYEGEFKDGKKDGRGTLTYPDGEKYEEEWKEDSPWTGTRTNADGSKTGLKGGKEI